MNILRKKKLHELNIYKFLKSKNYSTENKKLLNTKISKNIDINTNSYYKYNILNKKFLFMTLLLFLIPILVFLLNKVKKETIYKTKTITNVGLCIICKRENLYIKEFIDHYKNLGYNHIFLYDNNNIDDENFENVLQNEIDEGFVSITNYRGIKCGQFKAYADCYEKNNKQYDWISFFDVDEFLVLKPNNIKIQDFLNNKRYKKCENIKINWLIYTDNDKLYYEKKPVQERFTEPLYDNVFFNKHIKSTVRGNLSTNYWFKANNPHTSDNEYIACSSSGYKVHKSSAFLFPPDYKYAVLKHYRTKTIEEYCNKMKRGRADKKIYYKEEIEWFFATNKVTKEKINYFKKVFNIEYNKKSKSKKLMEMMQILYSIY